MIVTKFKIVGLLALFAMTFAALARADSFDAWIPFETAKATEALLANISPAGTARGVVVASPSREEPNYFYHWIRDAGLVMNAVNLLNEKTGSDHYSGLLLDFADLSRRNQLTPNPSGDADGTGLGEPKFNVDGSAFSGSWGRPQSDGPAVRAITMIRFARGLLARGQENLVRSKFYDSRLPSQTVIKNDLEYVSHHWRELSFDLWEEVRGNHFYTRMLQRRALVEGADLAARLGDEAAATWYRSQAGELGNELNQHWNAQRGYISVTINQQGMDYKSSGLDSSTILAVLHTADGSDRFFAPNDDRVLATAEKLAKRFQSDYGVNAQTHDRDGAPLGPAIGRYPEDHYNGYDSSHLGNPWVLSTAALGELYYRAAHAWEKEGRIEVTAPALALLGRVKMRAERAPLAAGDVVSAQDPRFRELLDGVRGIGDGFLRRVRQHANADGSLNEEINRDSGYLQGARDLSWNYAAMLTAFWAR